MTFSYLSTAPYSSDRSWIRLTIGDTTSGDALQTDEELDAHLSEGGNKYTAAALAAESIGAYFARRADKQAGRLQIAASQASAAYFKLAERLRGQAGLGAHVAPYAGGITYSDKETDEDDSDRVVPGFTVDMLSFTSLTEPSTGSV